MDALEEKDGAGRDGTLDVAGLAHELRTPLSAITLLAEIMRDERLGPMGSPKYRGYAADIHQSASHATSVLAGWLEAAGRNMATGGSLEFVELDPAEVVAGAVSALSPLAAKAGVILESEIGLGLPRLIADRRSLRQILDNLITNSMKFTPPGGQISARVAYLPGRDMVIEISDTGDGMTPAELARARSSAPPSEALRLRSGGTGAGLALVRALAAAGGARLRVDSVIGQGTTVTVAFGSDRLLPV